jgi:hypothetical protein
MRKSITIAVTVLCMFALVVAPAAAITGTFVPDFDHPFVAMVVFYDHNGDFVWRCSGSLINSTTVLTAGHCTDSTYDGIPGEGAYSARIYLQQDAGANYDPAIQEDPVTGYPDTCAKGTMGKLCMTGSTLYNYGFANFAGFPDTHDVGLVILDRPIKLAEYGQLPTAGLIDTQVKNDTIFTVSGYGLSYSANVYSAVPSLSYRVRLEAESTLVNTGSANTDGYNLQTQGNGDDRGGTCSGDSGGPVFLGGPDSNIIVGVTSFGMNSICRGTDFSYRVDQTAVLDWIASHMGK